MRAPPSDAQLSSSQPLFPRSLKRFQFGLSQRRNRFAVFCRRHGTGLEAVLAELGAFPGRGRVPLRRRPPSSSCAKIFRSTLAISIPIRLSSRGGSVPLAIVGRPVADVCLPLAPIKHIPCYLHTDQFDVVVQECDSVLLAVVGDERRVGAVVARKGNCFSRVGREGRCERLDGGGWAVSRGSWWPSKRTAARSPPLPRVPCGSPPTQTQCPTRVARGNAPGIRERVD
jgi:hypothetical protein